MVFQVYLSDQNHNFQLIQLKSSLFTQLKALPHPIDLNQVSPEQPIERDTTDERLTHLEGLAAEYDYRLNQQAEQMDGIRASLHAVTNARPYATSGELAIGAGVGFSGSKEAVAVGGAYGLTDQVSLSGTFHYESSGKYSSSDVAGGVGVQISFR